MPASANGRPDWRDKKIFTTGEAAKVCNVSQQTIIRCFDSGRLDGYRVPGSRFRRIPRQDLLAFMKKNGIPAEAIEGGAMRVLIVDDDAEILDILSQSLARDERFEVQTAATGYDAGLLTESFHPDVILLDYLLPDINGNLVCQRIRQNPRSDNTRIIIISGVVEQSEIDSLFQAGANDFLRKPFDLNALIEKITEPASK